LRFVKRGASGGGCEPLTQTKKRHNCYCCGSPISREATRENSPARKKRWALVFVYAAAPEGRHVKPLPPLRGLSCPLKSTQGLRPGLLLLRRFAASATSPCRRLAASTATVLSIARWRLGPTRP